MNVQCRLKLWFSFSHVRGKCNVFEMSCLFEIKFLFSMHMHLVQKQLQRQSNTNEMLSNPMYNCRIDFMQNERFKAFNISNS